jgi:hypothetical protein
MAASIFRAPTVVSRSILRLASVSLTFIVTLFLFATGQVVQPSGSGLAKSNQNSVVSPLGKMAQVVPLYGIIAPDYGIIPLYGPASAQFTIKGTIRSRDSGPIANILVTLTDTATKAKVDSGYAANDGTYSLSFTGLQIPHTWILNAKDVDGAANGRFYGKDTLVTIPSDSIVLGNAEKTIDLYLTKIATAVLPADAQATTGNLNLRVAPTSNGLVEIRFHLPAPGRTWMALYGADGRLVREVFDGSSGSGDHTVSIPISGLAQGAYFLKLHAVDQTAIAKVFFTR